MTARRKPQSQPAPAVDPVAALLAELVALQRVAVDHLAAMRASMEEATQPSAAINDNDEALIDPDDLLTVQQASGLAVRDEKTIRRWLRDFEISIVLGGTLFIRKSKLLAHLAHTKRSVD
jgi:hypothetical protein